jgi:GH43 family beta-xylosidase
MTAAVFDHVIDSKCSLLTAAHRLIVENVGQFCHRCFVGGVIDDLTDIVVQVVSGEGHQIKTESDTFALNASTVPTLFSEHWNPKHWNAMN